MTAVMAPASKDVDDVRFTSSPNWYCTKVIDSDGERLFAIGSRNSVVLLDIGKPGQCETNEQPSNLATVNNDDWGHGNFSRSQPIERVSIRLLDGLHADRISGVSFDRRLAPSAISTDADASSLSQQRLLATVGDDLVVNAVDVSANRRLASAANEDDNLVIAQHREHKARIVSVTWSTSANALSRCVLSGDENGTLILFNVASGKTSSYKPIVVIRGCILTCVEACPLKPHLVAVGYRGGLIIIVDLRVNGEAMRFLRHHDDDIQALSWAPFVGFGSLSSVAERSSSSDDANDQLFASASKDRTFRIWSTKQEAPIRMFRLPTVSRNYGGRRRGHAEEGKVQPTWLTAHWPTDHPDTLLAGSQFGELIAFDLKRSECDRCWSVVGVKDGKGHSRTIFSVVTCNGVACTVSMDRQIVFWDLASDPFCWLMSMPTLGGYVYSLSFSPVNPALMAIGCGDNTIRTWNTTSTSSSFEMETFWQGIKSKVTALSWHPRKEGLIAFGTHEGRVAVCNVLSNKSPSLSKNFHRKVVYTLAWGPVCPASVAPANDHDRDVVNGKDVAEWRLYSCGGDGNILVHDPSNLDSSALVLDKLIGGAQGSTRVKAAGRTDIAFKSDFSILSVGNEDGTVELYDTVTLFLKVIVCSPRKLVQCIRWHPEFTMSSATKSDCRCWLAVSSRDHSVHVHDLRAQFLKRNADDVVDETSQISSQRISTPSYELVGHRAAVASVAWSPHRDGLLVSASFDGTLRVWNVAAMETLACFFGHTSRVLCVEWNPLDEDRIASGGEDFTVRMWAVSQHNKSATNVKYVPLKAIPSRKSTVRSKPEPRAVVKEETKAPSISQRVATQDFADSLAELQAMLERRRLEILMAENGQPPVSSALDAVNGYEEKSEDADDASIAPEHVAVVPTKAAAPSSKKKVDVTKKEKRAVKSMFPLSNVSENSGKQRLLTDCRLLADHIAGIDSTKFGASDTVSLGAYGGRLDAYRLLKAEGEHHMTSANHDYAAHLEVWKGNVADFIRKAAAEDRLNDWLLSMAPIVSHGFWAEMCELYAKQLVTCGQCHKAVTFLLANQNVSEAIAVLKKHVSYKEAIVLAKVRLAADDPCIRELTEEWAAQCERECLVEQAAKCYLSLGRVDKAATLLAQRQDAVSFRTAAYVMRRGCADEAQLRLANEYAVRAAYECLVSNDRTTLAALIDEEPHLKPFFLVAETHRLLVKKSSMSKKGEQSEVDVASVLEGILETWLQNDAALFEDDDSVDRAISLVSLDVFPSVNPSSNPQVMAQLALKLSRALFLALRQRFEDAMDALLKVAIMLHRVGNFAVTSWYFASVLPRNLGDEPSVAFAFLNAHGVRPRPSPSPPPTSLDWLRCYRDVTFLRELHAIAERLPQVEPRSAIVTPSIDGASDVSSWQSITEKLVSTVLSTDDRSDVENLRVRLNELKADVAGLTVSDDGHVLQEDTVGTNDGDLLDIVPTLSDVVCRFWDADVCDCIGKLLKRTSSLRSEPNRMLMIGLCLLAERDVTCRVGLRH